MKASQTEQSQTNGGEASWNSLEISSQEAKNKSKKCINFQFCQQMTDFRDLIAGSYSESLNITDLSEQTCGAYRVFGTGFHTHWKVLFESSIIKLCFPVLNPGNFFTSVNWAEVKFAWSAGVCLILCVLV